MRPSSENLAVIALGVALGLVLLAVVAIWRWRVEQRRRRAQRNIRVQRAPLHVPPPPPNVRLASATPIELTPAERAEGWSVKTLGGMQVKVLPEPPTSADPWDDDEPTTYRAPGGKR